MMQEALVTIGLPCYNAAATIARAIESARAQDWPNLEIIVVDDCSTDGSVSVIERESAADARVRFVKHAQNQGPAAARNTIMKYARGDFIAFFDDDDESDPKRCRVQLEKIIAYEHETGQDLLACYASGVRVYPNGYSVDLRAVGSEGLPPRGAQIADYIFTFHRAAGVFYGAGTPTCALMLRAATLKKLGGFDPTFRRVEDLDLAVRLGLAGGHFIGCPEKLLRQNASLGNDKTPIKNFQAEQQLVEKHKAYLLEKGWYVYGRDWPKIRYYHFTRDYARMLGVLCALTLKYPRKTLSHFFETGIRRFFHERKMKAQR